MHFIDGIPRLAAARNIRLIRDDQQEKTARLESRKGFSRSWNNPKVRRSGRRIGFPIANNRLVKDAIAV